MCPKCGQLLKKCICSVAVAGCLCQTVEELPLDKHDHPKTPKAETTITNKYAATVTTSAMTITIGASNQEILAALENIRKHLKDDGII
jgi:hypothetical protein